MNGIGMKNGTRRDWTEAVEKCRLEGACRNCGDTHGLECAHTISRAQGGGQTADSVLPLCALCHRSQHAGNLDLLPLLSLDEQLEAVRVTGSIARAYRMLGGEA